MKITKARLKEIIMEELQNEGGGRGEGSMADYQLNRIADLAVMIDDIVSDETNLEEWVESKITKAHDYLSAVLNYLKGRMADAEEDEMGGEEDEEEVDVMAEETEEDLVAEVARRVAARLQTQNRKEQVVDALAERIMKRLTK